MLTALELTAALRERGHTAEFLATGQTGMLVEGDGCPVDAVVTDFISGAVEKQILAHQHHEVLVIEFGDLVDEAEGFLLGNPGEDLRGR